jgi:hypothetical protein
MRRGQLLRRLSLPPCRAGTKLWSGVCVRRQAAPPPPAVEHHCSKGATSDRPRSISCFAGGTHEARLRHACRPIKAERPITRAAQGSLPPPLSRSPTLFRSAFNPRHPRYIRLPSRKRRASDRRSSCDWTLCSQVSFRPPEARWSRNPACVWLHSQRQSEYIRAAGEHSHDNLRHIQS